MLHDEDYIEEDRKETESKLSWVAEHQVPLVCHHKINVEFKANRKPNVGVSIRGENGCQYKGRTWMPI